MMKDDGPAKEFYCGKCGQRLSSWDLEGNDYLCPGCKQDFWGTGTLKHISKKDE